MEQTTMTLRHQNFMLAVRKEMGWPLFRPANDCLAFASGRPMDFEIGMDTARLAQAMRKDVIYSGWSNPTAVQPASFAVVIREVLSINIIDRVFPWAADENAPVALISTRANERYIIGQRGVLERAPGKPNHLAEGRKLAMSRIRATAAAMGDVFAENNVCVSPGGKWTEPEQELETIVRFN